MMIQQKIAHYRIFNPADVRVGTKAAVRATLALSLLCPPKRKSEAPSMKSHLRRVFEKTSTNRQAELVKLVAGYLSAFS
jgi:hypothetical protein